MINWLKGLQHPEAYHGEKSGSPYFEGWYHKLLQNQVSRLPLSLVYIVVMK